MRGENHHLKLTSLVARPEWTTRGRSKLSFPKVFWNHWIRVWELEVTQRSLNLNFILYGHENWVLVRLPGFAKIAQISINRGSLAVKLSRSCPAHILPNGSRILVLLSVSLGKHLPPLGKPLHWTFHPLSSCFLSGKTWRLVLGFLEILPVRLVLLSTVLKLELVSKAWALLLYHYSARKSSSASNICSVNTVVWHYFDFLI